MNHNKFWFAIALFCYSQVVSGQGTVFLKAENQIGRGVLLHRNEHCFVMTPLHVVVDQTEDITITSKGMAKGTGRFFLATDSDLALLRTTSIDALCSDWDIDEQISKILESVLEGHLEVINEDGSSEIHKVDVVGKDDSHLYIKFRDSNSIWTKGMSGSPMYISAGFRKVFLGQLLSVDLTQTGIVLNAARIRKLLDDAFVNTRQTVEVSFIDPKKGGLNGELCDRAVEILTSLFPDKRFVSADKTTPAVNNRVEWVMGASSREVMDDKIDFNMVKYKTNLFLTIRAGGKTINREYLGSAADYDTDQAIRNSIFEAIRNIK